MLVRIRFDRGLRVKKKRRKNQHVALAAATLLSPVKFTALAFGSWRLAADLGLAGRFAVERGMFSHWQVWMGMAGFLQVAGMALNRYGHPEGLSRIRDETLLEQFWIRDSDRTSI